MQNFPWDQTIVGWIHISSAALIVGFLLFWAFGLQPASAAGSDSFVRSAVSRYKGLFYTAAVLLLLTGGYTWSVRKGQNYPGFYFHMVYTKILLWAILLGLAGPLLKMREGRNPKTLLTISVVVCLILIFLSAIMRRIQPLPHL